MYTTLTERFLFAGNHTWLCQFAVVLEVSSQTIQVLYKVIPLSSQNCLGSHPLPYQEAELARSSHLQLSRPAVTDQLFSDSG